MSIMFNRIKQYYDSGKWSETAVKKAVERGWITAAEYENITGKIYEG